MKKFNLLMIFFLFFSMNIYAQLIAKNENSNQLNLKENIENKSIFTSSKPLINYEEKYQKFKRMRNTGIVLATAGSAAIILGRVFLFGDRVGGVDEVDQRIGGVMAIGFGMVGVAGGVTLWAIGANKMGKYKNAVSFKPTQNGVGLAYQF